MFYRSTIAGALLFMLGACSGQAVHIVDDNFDTAYDFTNFDIYMAGRDTKVHIHGNPFAMDKTAFADAVAKHMHGANEGRTTNFTTRPKNWEKEFRVVVVFNGDFKSYALCNAKNFKTKKPDGNLTVDLAWCFEDRQDSAISAITATPKSVDDPRFRALIRQSVRELFPTGYDLTDETGDDERRTD